MNIIQVMTSTAERSDSQRIARLLLERRLAACVQISGPVESHYWWKGQLDSANEWLCTIKTRHELYSAVEQAIREVHPYEVPEILAIPVTAGSESYLQWLNHELDP